MTYMPGTICKMPNRNSREQTVGLDSEHCFLLACFWWMCVL